MQSIYLAICFLFMLSVYVSDIQAQQADFGIKGGISPYTLSFGNETDKSGRARTHLGFFSTIDAGWTHWGKFTIQPEIIYSLQGAELPDEDRLITLDYINIPILLQLEPVNGLRLQAGPQAGFLLTATSDREGATTDLSRRTNSFDFAITTGISYLHRPARMGFDLRYNLGLRNISNTETLRSRNRGFQIGIFYLFDFGDQL